MQEELALMQPSYPDMQKTAEHLRDLYDLETVAMPDLLQSQLTNQEAGDQQSETKRAQLCSNSIFTWRSKDC